MAKPFTFTLEYVTIVALIVNYINKIRHLPSSKRTDACLVHSYCRIRMVDVHHRDDRQDRIGRVLLPNGRHCGPWAVHPS